MSRRLFVLFLTVLMLVVFAVPISAQGTPTYTGMVSTSNPYSSQVGAQILSQGGNAIDAAVAVQFALNVVEPSMSGIGGGGFMMIYLVEEDKTVIIDCREIAPAGATAGMFQGMSFANAVRSGLSVGVPGTLDGLLTALAKYGTKPLGDVIDPAIVLAEDGFIVNAPLASNISGAMSKFNDAALEVFAPGGNRILAGQLLVQQDLAKTFRLIREHGAAAFYGAHPYRVLVNNPSSQVAKRRILEKFGEPEIGQAIIETVQEKGSSMTLDDLAAYTPKFRKPVRADYRGFEVVSMPPPSSGGLVILQMLKILEEYDIKAMGHNSEETLHYVIETMKVAFADRNRYLADDDFVDIPYNGYLDDRYIAERRSLIDPLVAKTYQPGDPWQYEDSKQIKGKPDVLSVTPNAEEGAETTHFTVRDKWGNMVSYTTTIESSFGSGMMVPGYGFMLNNELTDFDFTPGGANEVAPGKRPRSSMSPTIVFKDGQPLFSGGSPGGATIINTVFQVIMNIIDHDLSVQEAINASRVSTTGGMTVSYETRSPGAVTTTIRNNLSVRGHRWSSSTLGSVQSIMIDPETGELLGGADPRREGTVIGVY